VSLCSAILARTTLDILFCRREDVDHRNFKITGKLAEDTNMVNGVVVKYSEVFFTRETSCADYYRNACSQRKLVCPQSVGASTSSRATSTWVLTVPFIVRFSHFVLAEPYVLHRFSCYLIGRERKERFCAHIWSAGFTLLL
jgi:hypothetical protein